MTIFNPGIYRLNIGDIIEQIVHTGSFLGSRLKPRFSKYSFRIELIIDHHSTIIKITTESPYLREQ